MIELVRALSSRQGTLSQCALAIAVDPAPLAEAHPPALAPLSPLQSFLPSEVDIAGLRLSFGSNWVIRRCTTVLCSCRSRCAVNTCSYVASSQLVILVRIRPPHVKSQKQLTKIYEPYLETLMHARLLFNLQYFPLVLLEKTAKKIYINVLRQHLTGLVPECRPIRYVRLDEAQKHPTPGATLYYTITNTGNRTTHDRTDIAFYSVYPTHHDMNHPDKILPQVNCGPNAKPKHTAT